VTSFLSIPYYSPVLVLAAGLATFVGLWGVGTALLHLVRVRLHSPWNQVTAILLGIQVLSVTVQIVGMAEIASASVLYTIWWTFVAIGTLTLLLGGRPTLIDLLPVRYGLALLPITIITAAVLINALVALAPSTKIDELYYHMLIPSRIVVDGALRFYREPWLSAIGSHMVYQISAAPAHAIGYPDATNVVSWALSITLLWFAWKVIRATANTVPWTAFCVASLCVGLYTAVWHVTGGAHAMGDLALAAAIVAFSFRERLLATLSPSSFAAMLSIFLLSASTSKVTLVPASGILLCVGVWPLLRLVSGPVRLQIAAAVVIPWIVFYCPIAWWTWRHSGSPYGPILATAFESSVYSARWVQSTFQVERDTGQLPLFMIRNAALGYSPLIWLGAIGTLLSPDLARSRRMILGCLLALQCGLIYWLLPYDVRYLSLHYGLFIVFACLGPQVLQEQLSSARVMPVACAILLLPWLGIQFYYAKQFFPVSAGLEKESFYKRYVALYSDYVELDHVLSRQTVLLASTFRLSAVYSPRPIFFDPADLPPGRPVALLVLQGDDRNELGEQIYENPLAVIRTYRTPGRAPLVASMKVRLVEKW
jgi:hypothetical protein